MEHLLGGSSAGRIRFEVAGDARPLPRLLSQLPWVESVQAGEATSPHDRPGIIELTTSNAEEAQRGIPALLAARGLALRSFEMVEPALEEVFVDLVSEPDR